jgi:putative RNA 2'-phosphotransferase
MDEKTKTSMSRFLSLVLRPAPETIGIQLDGAGWVAIETLIAQCNLHDKGITRRMLDEIVATSPKRRFAVSEDGLSIRASQGHSVDVELGYESRHPPELLFHGTVAENLESIRETGLKRMTRNHVHLSIDVETARAVGARRGKPVVFTGACR